MVDSFKGRKSGERSLESKDSRRGIGNSLEELLFSFERPGMVTRYCGGIAQLGERLNGIQEVSGSIPLTSTKFIEGQVRFRGSKGLRYVVLRIPGTHLENAIR